MGEDLESLAGKFLSNVDFEFRHDPDINEYDILPVSESGTNRNPVVVVDHKLGIESWAAGLLFCSVSNNFRQWLARGARHQSVTDSDWLCSVTRVILLVTADHMTAWNIRKDLVKNGRLCMEDDLRLSALILGKHPKSCETFAHRKWLINRWLRSDISDSPTHVTHIQQAESATVARTEIESASRTSTSPSRSDIYSGAGTESNDSLRQCMAQPPTSKSLMIHSAELHRIAQRELEVCHRAADCYHSNYNAWSHRIWVLTQLTCCRTETIEKELTKMRVFVDTHVSDYSGFHYRQCLLNELYPDVLRGDISISNGGGNGAGQVEEEELHSVKTSAADVYLDELELTTDLITRYPGHEAIWYHRRYVVCCRAKFSVDVDKSKSSSTLSNNTAEAHMPTKKKTKLDSAPERNRMTNHVVYDDERLFCEKVLHKCDDASWDATLVSRHLRWLNSPSCAV